jgi:hypothetical protein
MEKFDFHSLFPQVSLPAWNGITSFFQPSTESVDTDRVGWLKGPLYPPPFVDLSNDYEKAIAAIEAGQHDIIPEVKIILVPGLLSEHIAPEPHFSSAAKHLSDLRCDVQIVPPPPPRSPAPLLRPTKHQTGSNRLCCVRRAKRPTHPRPHP